MNVQEIKGLSAKWIELVKNTTTAQVEKGNKGDIIAVLDISFEMEDYEKFSGDEKWLADIEAQLLRGIELAKKWGYELPVTSTPAQTKPAVKVNIAVRTPAQENERLHALMSKMDKWEAQGFDQWGLAPVRWDVIR